MAVVLWAILLNTMVTLAGKPQAILGLQHRLLKTSNNLRMDRGDIYGDKGFGLNNILPWWTLKGNEKHPMTAKPRSAPKKKNEALSVPVGVMTSNNYTKKKMMHYERVKRELEPIIFKEYNVVLVMLYLYECLYEKLSLLNELLLQLEKIFNLEYIAQRKPIGSCSELLHHKKQSGYYTIYIDDGMVRPVTVYCDMETRGGGWLEVQRRRKNIEKHVNFTRGWNSYKLGFGNPETEFWLGLENLHILTNRQKYELRIDLKSEDGKTAYAQYDNFYVDGEGEDYRLHVSGFMGTAGDAFGGKYDTEDGGDIPRGVPFSTVDRDRSSGNCSSKYCGGWWYLNCGWNRLNSPHFSTIEHYRQGMKWSTFTAKVIEDSTMMIRPVANSDISTELSTCTCAREGKGTIISFWTM
ncbi:techylectin-5B-like [Portunus trituberculatus]|uniref:techylectin-5B-like n=1 Tax=Portunus trituberculatus TaxID=210409 RepID=UPI001E1CCDEE|nr:techylectin-5B-like [Portunus trituberculatus]